MSLPLKETKRERWRERLRDREGAREGMVEKKERGRHKKEGTGRDM